VLVKEALSLFSTIFKVNVATVSKFRKSVERDRAFEPKVGISNFLG